MQLRFVVIGSPFSPSSTIRHSATISWRFALSLAPGTWYSCCCICIYEISFFFLSLFCRSQSNVCLDVMPASRFAQGRKIEISITGSEPVPFQVRHRHGLLLIDV